MRGFTVWLAQGFGVGRIPIMPGTFGSLLGILWTMLLLGTRNLWLYVAGTAAGFFISVWLCGAAEKILRKKDPSSVVLDEISAFPLCFLAFFSRDWLSKGSLPAPESLLLTPFWKMVLLVFVLFRIFD